jgi:hypothetical protein
MNGDEQDKKPYVKPEIIEDLELETRAGTPITSGDPLELP